MPPEPHRYSLLGLAVASELALPELAPDTGGAAPALTIRLGAVQTLSGEGPLRVAGDEACLNAAAGRFLVRGGAEITIDPRPAAAAADLRGYLLGPVLGIVCHQRGLLPLHASAIVAEGAAIAFVGASSAGKSTLAAHFQGRGYPVLCDDICAIENAAKGQARALVGTARLKLWPDALRHLGYADRPDGPHKGELPIIANGRRAGAPLRCVYLLGADATDGRFGLAPLTGAAAVEALMANIFRSQYLPVMGRLGQALAAISAIARQVPIFALHRSGHIAELAREAERLEQHFMTVEGVRA